MLCNEPEEDALVTGTEPLVESGVSRGSRRILTRGTIAFVLLSSVTVAAYLVLLVKQLGYGLEFDESSMLDVVRSLARGEGYGGGGLWQGQEFGAGVTTGPVLLVPAAVAWMVTDGSLAAVRVVPILFFLGYLAGAWMLFYRWAGRWPALAAVAAPLLLPVLSPDLANRSLMPGRLVGELAALTCLTWAAYLLTRHRPLWAGLVAGLSIQTKFIFVVPVVVLLILWVFTQWVARRDGLGGITWRYVVGAAAPTVAFELVKLVRLGPAGYMENVERFQSFSNQQEQTMLGTWRWLVPKSESLAELLSGPMVGFGVVALAGLGFWLITLRVRERGEPGRRRTTASLDALMGIGCLTVAATAYLAWWFLRSTQLSVRPAVPAVLVLLGVACAVSVVLVLDALATSEGRLRAVALMVVVMVVGTLVLSIAYQGIKLARDNSGAELLANQRAAAAVLLESTPALPQTYWFSPEFGILTDLPFERESGSESLVFVYTSIFAKLDRGVADARVYLADCEDVLFESRDVLVCSAPRP